MSYILYEYHKKGKLLCHSVIMLSCHITRLLSTFIECVSCKVAKHEQIETGTI